MVELRIRVGRELLSDLTSSSGCRCPYAELCGHVAPRAWSPSSCPPLGSQALQQQPLPGEAPSEGAECGVAMLRARGGCPRHAGVQTPLPALRPQGTGTSAAGTDSRRIGSWCQDLQR